MNLIWSKACFLTDPRGRGHWFWEMVILRQQWSWGNPYSSLGSGHLLTFTEHWAQAGHRSQHLKHPFSFNPTTISLRKAFIILSFPFYIQVSKWKSTCLRLHNQSETNHTLISAVYQAYSCCCLILQGKICVSLENDAFSDEYTLPVLGLGGLWKFPCLWAILQLCKL